LRGRAAESQENRPARIHKPGDHPILQAMVIDGGGADMAARSGQDRRTLAAARGGRVRRDAILPQGGRS